MNSPPSRPYHGSSPEAIGDPVLRSAAAWAMRAGPPELRKIAARIMGMGSGIFGRVSTRPLSDVERDAVRKWAGLRRDYGAAITPVTTPGNRGPVIPFPRGCGVNRL